MTRRRPTAGRPADRLSLLAGRIAQSGIGPENHIYVDGFTDFTRQEQQVLEALLKTGAELTLCMTLDSLSGGSEIYELSRRSCRKLLAFCRELGQEAETELLEAKGEKAEALAFFADNMFSYADAGFAGEAPILLRRAESMTAECEFAAARALALVRDEGCRWRDIAVAVRGFEDYRGTLESVFRYYGVPLFTARRSELLSKPLPALIAGAYEIVDGGWDVDELISFMYTGLAGLDRDECDELSGYTIAGSSAPGLGAPGRLAAAPGGLRRRIRRGRGRAPCPDKRPAPQTRGAAAEFPAPRKACRDGGGAGLRPRHVL